MSILLELKDIKKSFSGVSVLEGIDMTLNKGEVLALIGENGAGKSTLMKILSGAYFKDSGDIIFEGQNVDIPNPIASKNMGISIIYQELSLIPTLSAGENIFLGQLPNKNGKVNWKYIYKKSKEYFDEISLNLSPKTICRKLSIAQQQMVEIARALSGKCKIVIMDEPTSSLTDKETQKLFDIVRKLKSHGIAVVYISHKLEEVMEISDRVVVLKDGKLSGVRNTCDTSKDELVRLMVGRDLDDYYPAKTKTIQDNILLEIKNLSSGSTVKNVSFKLYSGEILGFAGLVGAGRTETMRAIFGADIKERGEVIISGQPVHISRPKEGIKSKIAFVTEDRRNEGLVTKMSVKENTTMASYQTFSNKLGHIDKKKEKKIAAGYVDKLSVRTDSVDKKTVYLSGGNQQKVVIAKWINTDADIYIFDEPTRGVDVGAKAEIYQLMVEMSKNGKGVIMVSSELPEIIGLSDRVLVMHEGKIAGELTGSEITEENIMQYAVGGV